MCGIVGYIGKKNAVDILIDGLKKLEYRGYDSSGIAIVDGSPTDCGKSGRQACKTYKTKLRACRCTATWASVIPAGQPMAVPSDANAHPAYQSERSVCSGA